MLAQDVPILAVVEASDNAAAKAEAFDLPVSRMKDDLVNALSAPVIAFEYGWIRIGLERQPVDRSGGKLTHFPQPRLGCFECGGADVPREQRPQRRVLDVAIPGFDYGY